MLSSCFASVEYHDEIDIPRLLFKSSSLFATVTSVWRFNKMELHHTPFNSSDQISSCDESSGQRGFQTSPNNNRVPCGTRTSENPVLMIPMMQNRLTPSWLILVRCFPEKTLIFHGTSSTARTQFVQCSRHIHRTILLRNGSLMGFVYAERRRCSRLNSAITMRYRPLELGTSENLRHFFAALRMLCTSICLDFRIEILPNRIEISRCERRIFIRREAEKHQV